LSLSDTIAGVQWEGIPYTQKPGRFPLTLSPAMLDQLGQPFLKDKMLQNLYKIKKIIVLHRKTFFFSLLLQGNTNKLTFYSSFTWFYWAYF
jgi:hypothetical protein